MADNGAPTPSNALRKGGWERSVLQETSGSRWAANGASALHREAEQAAFAPTRFRARVLQAYDSTCAMCRLRHVPLLDAAHILPGGHSRGRTVVPNGLALCKIHHAAYDQNILGVRPDLKVEVGRDILAEVDGPMLRHGLREMSGVKLLRPHRVDAQADPLALEERYEEFLRAG